MKITEIQRKSEGRSKLKLPAKYSPVKAKAKKKCADLEFKLLLFTQLLAPGAFCSLRVKGMEHVKHHCSFSTSARTSPHFFPSLEGKGGQSHQLFESLM